MGNFKKFKERYKEKYIFRVEGRGKNQWKQKEIN